MHNSSEIGKLTLDIQNGMIDFYELESESKEKYYKVLYAFFILSIYTRTILQVINKQQIQWQIFFMNQD